MSNGRRFKPQAVSKGRNLLLTVEIPEDAPAQLKEGLARQRLCSLTGRCPCGATASYSDWPPKPGMVIHVTYEHENDCPAAETNIRKWL